MANYFADTLKVKSSTCSMISGAYGVGIADSFQKQAENTRIKVLGATSSTRRKPTTPPSSRRSRRPIGRHVLWRVAQAGVKLCKQAYDVNPKMIQGWRRRHGRTRDT